MYKILLVDDEILVREVIRQKIQWSELGFELVADCEDGQEAIDCLEETEVDVVLTDIYMPHVDGLQLSRYVYEHRPQTAVLIFSGYNDFEYAREAMKYQVSEYLLKPVTARELTEALIRIREKLDSERTKEARFRELARGCRNYTKNESMIISRTLSRLAQGTQSVKESLAALAELNIYPRGKAFQVIVLELDPGPEQQERALMAFAVENVSAELMGDMACHGTGKQAAATACSGTIKQVPDTACHRTSKQAPDTACHSTGSQAACIAFHDTDSRVNLLLSFSGNALDDQNQVGSMCEKIQQTVHQLMGIGLTVAVGRVVQKLEDLPHSYRSALAVLEYRYAKGTNGILDSEAQTAAGSILGMDRYIRDIRRSVLEKSPALLHEAVQAIGAEVRRGWFTKSELIAFLYQLFQVIQAGVHDVDPGFRLSERELAAITDAPGFEEALGFLAAYASRGIKALEAAADSGNRRLAKVALAYLRDHYAQADLALSDVSAHLNLSSSHFTYIFKEATGQTFIEALTAIRMEKAKLLLAQTGLKNYEIAERVGFTDPHYFGIAFKKATGLSPKAYARKKQT